MSILSRYDIAYKGLKEGTYQFKFEIDNEFFDEFENSLVNKGEVKAKVSLIKQSTLLIIEMAVKGTVELMCDRCLDQYNQRVKNKNNLLVKFGIETEELSDDLIVLPLDEYQINIAQYLYELIILGLPIKHVHPDDKNGNSTCNPEMLKELEQYLVDTAPINNENVQVVDERWNELKKLLDNK
ncbi:MAG TPA: DUF177 domain-containing protein [Prolixibacteraceae bacterium]|nr:DUF177 domain-containing protein [Prolixibacteraceae bacterium]